MNSQRQKQQLPREIAGDLLQAIRSAFYGDLPTKRFMQDRQFLLRNVVTWPARWLNKRGVTLPPDRYKRILLDVFVEIKRHGATGVVSYWPGYLMKCVQSHFAIHGEEYYEEGKALRAKLETVMLACHRAPTSDPVAGLAQVHAVLSSSKRSRRKPATDAKQGNLFEL
jgi:hypothetical protein